MGRDKFVLNPSANTPSHLRRFEFLGKLIGVALRHGLHFNLDLPSMFWRRLVGVKSFKLGDFEEIDVNFVNDLKAILKDLSSEVFTAEGRKVGSCVEEERHDMCD